MKKDEISKLPGLSERYAEDPALQAFVNFKILQCHRKGPVPTALGAGILGSPGSLGPGFHNLARLKDQILLLMGNS